MSIIAEVTDRASAIPIGTGHDDPEDFVASLKRGINQVEGALALPFDYRRELVSVAAIAIRAIEVFDKPE